MRKERRREEGGMKLRKRNGRNGIRKGNRSDGGENDERLMVLRKLLMILGQRERLEERGTARISVVWNSRKGR